MTSRSPIPDADDELLSAWLDGDLDDVAAAGLERRLRTEPELALRADRQHDLIVALRRLDQVQPPDGYRQRLATRVAAERGTAPAASRASRAARGRVLTAAAAGLISVAALGGAARWLAAPSPPVSLEAAPETAAGAAGETGPAGDDAGSQALADSTAPVWPEDLIVDSGAALPAVERDPGPLRGLATRLLEGAAVAGILGRPVEDAQFLAAQAQDAAAAALPDEPCLQQPLSAAPWSVPARIELLTVGDDPAMAVAVVEASPDSAILNRSRVLVLDRMDCTVLLDEAR